MQELNNKCDYTKTLNLFDNNQDKQVCSKIIFNYMYAILKLNKDVYYIQT